ncbi:MAG: AEC family transporter [Firmicutes bacterium]|nr:AEC family transporter [Bacillota bacterium]
MKELIILQVTLFALVAVGFFAKKVHMVGREGQKNLTDLVINIVLPCNIITSFMIDPDAGLYKEMLAVLLISLGIQIFCVILGHFIFRGQNEDHRRSLRYATICSNAGFLGNPIAEGVYGELGLMYASIYLIPQRIMMWSEGIAIYSGEKDIKGTIKKVLTHPCVVSCAAGIILMVTGIKLPDVILRPIQTIGRCTTALSMLVVGMILGEINLKSILDKTVVEFTILRLVLIPLVVYLICLLLPISRTALGVSVLLAAMPAGTTTSMLAAKYNRDPAFATKLVIFSTLCSIPAIMIWSIIVR